MLRKVRLLCFAYLTIGLGLPVDIAGEISTVAGNGSSGFFGDGGQATDSSVDSPSGAFVDAEGNLYIADEDNHRVRKVTPDGIVTTVAGSGPTGSSEGGFGGDGDVATDARLNDPEGVFVDHLGNLFIVDENNHRIRKMDVSGVITTVVGDGFTDSEGAGRFLGDGGLATEASLNEPKGVFVDGAGNVFVADERNHRVRRVDGETGIITSVAGNGTPGFSGEGGAAIDASLNYPSGVYLDGSNKLYIADADNHRVRMVDSSGIITTVAGTGSNDFSGDGGPATDAALSFPSGVFVDDSGNLLVSDEVNHRIRKIDNSGMITTVAGNGTESFAGDGGFATDASLSFPSSVFMDSAGHLFISDEANNRVRRVDPDGIMTTVAGGGVGDGTPATEAILNNPRSVFVGSAGTVYVADRNNHRIRKVDSAGTITTVAGNGVEAYSGDGGPATDASLNSPRGVFVDASGNLYIADEDNDRIRKVDVEGSITTVAGNGIGGFGCDGGPATDASLDDPEGVFVDAAGNIYIADTDNSRVRMVDLAGVITTVAGNGVEGFSGDGGPATDASMDDPEGVFLDGFGSLYVADEDNNRIRKVDPNGTITTVVGNGEGAFSGDGDLATEAALDDPKTSYARSQAGSG